MIEVRLPTLPEFTDPAIEVTPRGTIEIRDAPGFGYDLDTDYIPYVTVREEVLT